MKGGFFIRFVCSKCSNDDKDYFFFKGDKIYCRKCITFIGKKVDLKKDIHKGKYNLNYSLTDEQKKASEFILNHIKNNKNCALNAVCGAGKTEIIYDTIEYCLSHNKKIGIAIPRKDVVIELKERLSKDFDVSVAGVYGGNNEILQEDIIVFTTHQAYRYVDYFDVLIIDEIDAFPYKNNKELQYIISKTSSLFVYLSATMPDYIENDKLIDKYYINKRYHNYPLPVPKCKESLYMLFTLKRFLKRHKDKVVLVYFPTIKIQNEVAKKIKCDYVVNSKINDRENMLEKIKSLNKGIVFTTTVLERGITIKNVQVVVYNAEHKLFDKDTLIQISGRAGRKKEYPTGEILFICKSKNKEMKRAIKRIKSSNE